MNVVAKHPKRARRCAANPSSRATSREPAETQLAAALSEGEQIRALGY